MKLIGMEMETTEHTMNDKTIRRRKLPCVKIM